MSRLLALMMLLTFQVFAKVCHDRPEALLGDVDFKSIHVLMSSQEYVGNLGSKLLKRKQHDTYFNWESVSGFYGRLYNTKFDQFIEGKFVFCKQNGDFTVSIQDGGQETVLPLSLEEPFVRFKYNGISITLFAYPLQRHGTLRFKLRESGIADKVKSPVKWQRMQADTEVELEGDVEVDAGIDTSVGGERTTQ